MDDLKIASLPVSRRRFLAGLSAGSAMLVSGAGCSLRVTPPDMSQLTIAKAAELLRARQLSPVDLVKSCLDRIDVLNPQINAFITLERENALEQARVAEAVIKSGKWIGPLHGIPIGVKDNIDTSGIRTTGASSIFAERVPTRDAEVITKLKASGAIILGKLNMHKFAKGTTSAISHFGPVKNPWNVEYIAGGSSGGNGAAVAAGLCLGSVGTDTGGSVRIPAACCGITGFKPTYDVISTAGLIFISRSYDHIGPMCRTAEDAALMLSAMSEHPVAANFASASDVSVNDLRVGLLSADVPTCDVKVEPEVEQVFNAAVQVVRSCVRSVTPALLPAPENLGDIIDAESFAFEADRIVEESGVYRDRMRLPGEKANNMSPERYDELIRELKAHRSNITGAFTDVDLVIVPTLPVLPLKLDQAVDPFALNACTFSFSIGGMPAISIPCGFSASGLPIGMLIGGPPLSDAKVVALARTFQDKTDWHLKRPLIS